MRKFECGNTSQSGTSKSAQKWNVLKHGVIWAQKLRSSVKRLSSVDEPIKRDVVSGPDFNLSTRESPKLPRPNRVDSEQSSLEPKCAEKLPKSTINEADNANPSKSSVSNSPSFGDHIRQRANSAKCRWRSSTLAFDQLNGAIQSSADNFQEKVKKPEPYSPPQLYDCSWSSPYDPLPSPLIEPKTMELFHLSVGATANDAEHDELLKRNESSQSLESEPGAGEDIVPTAGESSNLPLGRDDMAKEPDDSFRDPDQVEAILRRGRRKAIIDEKSLIGDSENDCQDGVTGNGVIVKHSDSASPDSASVVSRVNVFRERQQRMLRKQHTIADLNSRIQPVVSPQDFDSKRRQNVFMKLIERRSRSKESLLDLGEALQRLTPSLFQDHYLESYRNSHWSTLDRREPSPVGSTKTLYSDQEIRRREAVWELFKSELIFFMDHLMVLKNCFMEPLKKLQVDGYLMFIEPSNLFGNLDDLCYVSHTLCRELIGNLTRDASNNEFGSTNVLLRPLKRWSEHSKDGEIYHSYCLNYDSALSYLDNLRKVDQFNEFEKWCEQDARCRRLQLTDLLVAPMQHYMKIPLLLASIRRYTADPNEQEVLTSCLNKVENSLKSLEDKMRWLKNFERLQEIQSQLIWPSISEMEPRVFIPEFLRQTLSRQPCERLIANPKRQLLHEGFLTFSDGSKIVEIFAFLFDDFFLITRIKKQPKKKSFTENTLNNRNLTEGGLFVVYRQAIALDRFTIHDVGFAEANANGLRHAFVLVLITRFQQITGVYTLQAANELDKTRWIEKLRDSQQIFQAKLKQKLYGIDSDHQTNKHSKLLLNKSKVFHSQVPTDHIESGQELRGSNPSRASSASPSSLIRDKTSSVDNHNEAEEVKPLCPTELPLPMLHVDSCRSIQNQTANSSDPDPEPDTNVQPTSAVSTPSRTSEQPDKTGADNDSQEQDVNRLTTSCFCSGSSPSSSNILTIKQRSSEGTVNDAAQYQKINTRMSADDLTHGSSAKTKKSEEGKVQFLYSTTGQSPFSPPLSPTLHAPCASLPTAITLPSFYEYPSSSFKDGLEHQLNQMHIKANESGTNEEVVQNTPIQKSP